MAELIWRGNAGITQLIAYHYQIENYKMKAEDLIKILNRMDSCKRMRILVEHIGALPDSEWLKALGSSWSMSDYVEGYVDTLLFESPIEDADRPIAEMMTVDEFEAWDQLPDIVELYRGCYQGKNDQGICFSLDRSTAEFFLHHSKFFGTKVKPVLLHCKAPKNKIIAVKLDRSEAEVITNDYEIVEDLLGNYEY